MKAFNFITILLIAAMAVASCSDDEGGTPRQISESHTYSQNLRGSVGVKGELPLTDLTLTDVIEPDVANKLTKAQLQHADSYLEISGLDQIESPDTAAVVLEDFTIKVGSRESVNLGNFSTNAQGINEYASDVQHSTNEIITLIENIFSDITSSGKRARITVSFVPNVDIDASDNVQLNIHFEGIYHYVEVE